MVQPAAVEAAVLAKKKPVGRTTSWTPGDETWKRRAGNLSKPLAPHSVEPEPGQIILMFPALLRGDRVLINLKTGAGTGLGLSGNPAVAVYAPAEGLFIFALQSFEGATACGVTLGRAVCSLEGDDYTLFSARPITGGDQESKIWVLRVPTYIPSRVAVSWRDDEGSIKSGELSRLLAELRVEGFASPRSNHLRRR